MKLVGFIWFGDSTEPSYNSGMRFFRIFPGLRGHSRGNPRSGLIFRGGGIVGTINCVYFATQSLIIAYTIILINFETILKYSQVRLFCIVYHYCPLLLHLHAL